jgi:hypothetical protein
MGEWLIDSVMNRRREQEADTGFFLFRCVQDEYEDYETDEEEGAVEADEEKDESDAQLEKDLSKLNLKEEEQKETVAVRVVGVEKAEKEKALVNEKELE